jgi:diguanylate cyclase (GGDEF)-like protein/PAS domain S-box-containing protein
MISGRPDRRERKAQRPAADEESPRPFRRSPMVTETTRGRRRLWLSLAALCFAVLSLIWVRFQLGGAGVAQAYDDIAEWASAWLAAGACLWARRRSQPRLRRFWALVGASAFTWGAGEVVWIYYEVGVGSQLPFPSLADVGFLAAAPLIVAALFAFPLAPLHSVARIRMLLDGAILAAAILFAGWAVVLGPAYRSNHDGVFVKGLTLAYPVSDLVTVVVVLCVAARAGRSAWRLLGLVGGGVLALAISDSAFAYLTQGGGYGLGNTLDVGWIVGYLLIALTPFWTHDVSERTFPVERPSRIGVIIPYVPVAGALSITLVYAFGHRELGSFLLVNGIVLVILLSSRQLLALLDNVSLGHRLAAKTEVQGRELVRQDARFAALVRRSTDLTTIVAADGNIVYQSPSSFVLLGLASGQLTGRNFQELLHPDDAQAWLHALGQVTRHPAGETLTDWRLRHQDGRYVDTESRVANLLDDPSVEGILINTRDVSERKRLEHELRSQAVHDPLTGLANRTLLTDRLERALALQARDSHSLAVLFVDIDDFKSVNDSRGHAAGDELLREVARRLESVVRTADTVARIGGDEFVIVLDGTISAADADGTTNRILDLFKQSFLVAGDETFSSASIGIAVADAGTTDAASLLQEADIAMYAAKASGKGRRETYRKGMRERVIDQLQLGADLRQAVERNELAVVYQPIVDLASGTMIGVEALMRWQHPVRGLLNPDAFIPLAETSGLIVPIGRRLLGQASRDLRGWQGLGTGPALKLNVNLSARQLVDPELVADLAASLSTSQLEPSRLTLEITETTLMRNFEALRSVFTDVKALGVKLAIDDFGTGYSSLSYLRQLPVDEIKIDRSFITAMSESSESANLVRTILQLAEDFHLTTIAEGVETARQLDQLRAAGCELAQAYLFAHPVSALQIRQGLRSGRFAWPQTAPATEALRTPIGV